MARRSDLLADALALRSRKPGDIVFLAGRPLGRGEMHCDGRELSRALYPRLFAAIDTTWGVGNGTTTFRIPDLRDSVLAGRGTMGIRGNRRLLQDSGIDSRNVGKQGGSATRTIEVANLPGGVLSVDPDFGSALGDGKTTGTGGDALRRTVTSTTALVTVQPTAICDFAICLGQDEIVIAPAPEPNTGTSDLEFNGPFPDWLNVLDYGADPTGVEDSTDAFKSAISDVLNQVQIGSNADLNTFYVAAAVYVPDGTYLITDTLILPDKTLNPGDSAEGFSMYGHSPLDTILKWGGNEDGVMVWAASWHSGTFGRMTLDGQGLVKTGFRIERDFTLPTNQSFNRIHDCFFQDMLRGIENTRDIPGASTDSEIDIMRCRFYRCAEYGVLPTAVEAYDYWVRSCYFEACGVGVGRLPQAYDEDFTLDPEDVFDPTLSGQYAVVDCVFNGSLQFDIDYLSGANTLVLRNQSFNSARFIRTLGCLASIAFNRVVNPIQTDCFQFITQEAQMLTGLVAKNEIKSRDGASGPVMLMLFDASVDNYKLRGLQRNADPRYVNRTCYFYANKFSVAYAPISYDEYTLHDIMKIDAALVGQVISEAPALICPVPPAVARETFYFTNLPVNGQTTINTAAAWLDAHPESRPVIYFPFFADGARRKTPTTLVFPANKKMSLQSSGMGTMMGWTAGSETEHNGTPILLFRGPTKMIVENFALTSTYAGSKHGLHVVVDNCNQTGARVYMEGSQGTYKFMGVHKVTAWFLNHNVNHVSDESFPMEFNGSVSEAATGKIVFELATGGGTTSDPTEIPWIYIRDGAQVFMRGYWHENSHVGQLQFRLEGLDQQGWFSNEASRWVPGDNYQSTCHWNDVHQITIDDWNGYWINMAAAMVGRPTILGDTSDFRYLNFTSFCYAFDDAGRFREFEGVPILVKGTVNNAASNSAEDHLVLPGYPTSYEGDDGDAYYSNKTGHLWVWKNDVWNNIGGIVLTVATEADLPEDWDEIAPSPGTGDYQFGGREKDCAIVAATNEVWEWTDDLEWVKVADGSQKLPGVYWKQEGSGNGIANQSGNWGLYRWYSTPPMKESGTLPGNYKDLLDKMLAPAPPKFIVDLSADITDFRCQRLSGWVQFVPATFELP